MELFISRIVFHLFAFSCEIEKLKFERADVSETSAFQSFHNLLNL